MKGQLIKHLIYIIILINTLLGQFNNFDSNIDLRQIRENERFHFENAVQDINDFFTINTFGTDLDYLEIDATFHLILESIIETNNQKVINAQAIITNRNDVIVILKSFSFPIVELKSISYNQNTFTPLNSLFEFAAYILIANELDTYQINGGNQYYNMARNICSNGKESSYSNGWDLRWEKSNELQENVFLRNTKYYFFYAYENLLNQDIQTFYENLYLMHEQIQSNNDFRGIDNNTKNFFKAYHEDIADYYFKIKFKEGLEYLISYDIDNKEIYQKMIKQLKND